MNRLFLGTYLTMSLTLVACDNTGDNSTEDWTLGDKPDMPLKLTDVGDPYDMYHGEICDFDSYDMAIDTVCGDGVITPGQETCDGDCPASIASCEPPPPEACARVRLAGSATACDAECVYFQQTACVDDDGCCPEECLGKDNDCTVPMDLCGKALDDQSTPASIISVLELGDRSVGFDFNGDGRIDNAFGEAIARFGPQFDVSPESYNSATAQRIDNGNLALVLEHQGLNQLSTATDFSMNMLHGVPQCFTPPDPTGENVYKISPESYTLQTELPISSFPMAALSGNAIQARGSSVTLTLDLLGAQVDVDVLNPQLSATLDAEQSGLPYQGVALSDGMLGGYIPSYSIYNGLNRFAASCTCATPPADIPTLFYYSEPDSPRCNAQFDTSACASSGAEGVCHTIISNCDLFMLLTQEMNDVDSSRPDTSCGRSGTCDSMSVGFAFTAAGAVTTGLHLTP